jgi:predicted nucleic acid-binding Zn finger protein
MISDEVAKELERGKLDYGLYRALLINHGKRGEKAFFYLKEKRVKRYRDFFVVVGEEEHVVDNSFCDCPDFQINLKAKKACAHILAVYIAKKLKLYDEVDAYYVDFME